MPDPRAATLKANHKTPTVRPMWRGTEPKEAPVSVERVLVIALLVILVVWLASRLA